MYGYPNGNDAMRQHYGEMLRRSILIQKLEKQARQAYALAVVAAFIAGALGVALTFSFLGWWTL